MLFIETIDIRSFELGLEFERGEFARVLESGRYRRLARRDRKVEVVDLREPIFTHAQLGVMIKTGALKDRAQVLDLADNERALVWIDGRFVATLRDGLFALWTSQRRVKTQVVDIRDGFFDHAERDRILAVSAGQLHEVEVGEGQVGALIRDGRLVEQLAPGRHVLWREARGLELRAVDLREQALDVAGQDLLTADRVALRINALVQVRVADLRAYLAVSSEPLQALYRSVQLALREAIGSRSLDELLASKDAVAAELRTAAEARAGQLGLAVGDVGIRDVILPGEMKVLLAKVTEAKAAAEANLITRREETAAMRSQLNTARLMGDHPMLLRMKELEVLERILTGSKLDVMLGEDKLMERVSKLL